MKKLLSLLALSLAASAALAGPIYSFYQGGYTDGAQVFGYFQAEDLDGDGVIEHNLGDGAAEVFTYSMTFSGNALVRSFSHGGLAALSTPDMDDDGDRRLGIRHVIGSGRAQFLASQNWSFIVDPAPWGPGIDWGYEWRANTISSTVIGRDGRWDTSAAGVMVVGTVPEPAAWTLLLMAAPFLLLASLWRKE